MTCIKSTAVINNTINTTSTIGGGLSVDASILNNVINTTTTIKSESLATSATIAGGIASKASIINSGINSEACPIILCIDGGLSSTILYPSVNGLLNGGTA